MHSKNKNNLIGEFWKWFEQKELSFRSILDEKETDLIDDILNKLIEIQDGLAVEFEKTKDHYVMTVSADGIEDNFDMVQAIIDKAPHINHWNFVAFRQPYDKATLKELVITVYGHTLDPKKIMFLPIVEDKNLYIQIFSKDINEETKNEVSYGCLMLLDNIIGEYACVKKVKGFEFFHLEEAVRFESKLRPLIEIRDYLHDYDQGK